MKYTQVLSLLLFTALAASFTPPGLFRNVPPPLDHYRSLYAERQQKLKPMAEDDAILLSDILPKTRSINIFASLTRDVSTVASRLESTQNTTLLAPLNSAMQSLPRKPWEDREDDKSDISAARNEEKAAQNIKRFVEEHAVPASPWAEGDKVKTLGGQELWWETRDGKRIIFPGDIEVSEVLGKTVNGQVWALRGVVNYR